MNPDSDGLPSANDVVGRPIDGLKELEQETSADFLLRVRRKIQRRRAASHIAAFSWQLPKVLLVEMADIVRQLFTALGSKKGPQQ